MTVNTSAQKTGPVKASTALWVQLARLLAAVATVGVLAECALLFGVVARTLERLPPETALAVRRALPIPGAGGDLSLAGQFALVSVCGLLLGVGVSLGLAVIAAKRFAAPLELAAVAAESLAGGKLETRIAPSAGSSTDSSEVGRVLASFNAMAERLENTEAERRYANAAIAHELRTPIAAIRGRLAGIRDGVFEPSQAELEKILKPLETLTRLADDLQLVMLGEADALRLELQRLNLSALLEVIVTGIPEVARRIDLEGEPTVMIVADPVRLTQAIGNVLENALRFTPPDQPVRVRLVSARGMARLSVADAGRGVAAAELERIFDRFYRGDASRSRDTGGSGLGLAVVRAVIESHGGEVKARRSDLGGLEIRMSLPTV